jgi:hypothetical protein
MNIRLGPQDNGAFPPFATVSCKYKQAEMSGASRKFECEKGSDVLKVRYGAENGEVFGSVLATRLLWALGFGADAVYPVRIRCEGCAGDPWTSPRPVKAVHEFDPAVIERKPAGRQVGEDADGWTWPEIALVNEAAGGASVAQTDGLTLLAVMLQHTDNKAVQQRLWCPPGRTAGNGKCRQPFLMIHDLGLTFGHANFKNNAAEASVNFERWVETPVWKKGTDCIGNINKSYSGTLNEPVIGEAGRAFLARLLQQLTDRQLHDLFDLARVDRRSRNPEKPDAAPATTEEWVKAFKDKREEIVTRKCPEQGATE